MTEVEPGSTLATGAASAPPSRQPHGLGLACRECQRKKVKCDRIFPCGPCTRGGIGCIPSTRKPRARIGARVVDAELRARIAKLEKIVHHFQGDEDSTAGSNDSPDNSNEVVEDRVSPGAVPYAAPDDSRKSSSSAASPSAVTEKYMAGTFWSSLTSEVQALKDIFEEDGQSEDEGSSSAFTPPSTLQFDPNEATSGFELLLCQPGAIYIMPGVLNEPDSLTAAGLTDAYLANLEPLQKLFHVPSLRALTHHDQPYLGREANAPCNAALKAALHYAGVVSLMDHECLALYGKPRNDLIRQYRQSVDLRLHLVDPMNTTELASLQALILYVGAIRIVDSSRRAWTLVGLLVRIARALNIHKEMTGESVYAAEIRRRVWHNVVFLDTYAAFDRGTEPSIHPDTFNRQLPTNVNDVDFDVGSTSIAPRPGEITDMTMARIAQECGMMVLRMSVGEGANSMTWQQRLEAAYAFRKDKYEKVFCFCDPTIPYHGLILGIGVSICHSMILHAVRPMHTPLPIDPPRVDSPWVLELAVNILRQCDLSAVQQDKVGAWRRMPWVPWHSMAVALAGLCSIRDTPLSNEAWDLTHRMMIRFGPQVADTTKGSLWRPLEKLRKKAAAFRDQGKNSQQTKTSVTEPFTFLTPNQVQMDHFPIDTSLQNISTPAMESVFDFSMDVHSTLPNDTSWLDWESIMKDVDELGADLPVVP